MTPDFLKESATHLPALVELRRTLHRTPEIGRQLPRTQRRVLDALDGLGLEIHLGTSLTSIAAVLRGGRPGPTVLLRGDMDGLPITEETGLPYASTNGNMHACGHDMHTAGLVGAARLLHTHRDTMAGNILFMFQPAEEAEGGAEPMIEEGLLDLTGERPSAAFAIHVVSNERGIFSTRSGPIMAGASFLDVTIRGRGGHSSVPHMTIDPVPAAAEIATALNVLVTREFDIFDPIVLSVTQLSGSTAVNVIPDTATVGACIRTLSREALEKVQRRSTEIAEGIARNHNCIAEVNFEVGYPSTINSHAETEQVLHILEGMFDGERVQRMDLPRMGSEDFSYVLNEVPGTFVFLGASPEGVDFTLASNHSPKVQFDDSLLGEQSATLAALAWDFLTPTS